MRLHNTMGQKIQEFSPQSELVTLYTCGPTVYDFPHIGNWSAYLRWDLLNRTLIDSGYKVNWVMNITDVGHLSSDADEGEDKLQKGARREGKTAWEIADFYLNDFKSGLDYLNIQIDRSKLPRATDHIAEQLDLIKRLEEKGFTYKIADGIYFDTSKLSDYGKLAKLDIAGLQAGARVDVGEKKHVTDFALWKFSPEDSQRDMEWDSPWGKGFPGWHLECSAMSMKYLGETIDIHGGGIDHIPVHHTNEIAQSEAVTEKQFVNYWLHVNHILVDGQKIAKSIGNGITLEETSDKGFTADDLRVFIFQSHYRTQSNFTWELLEAAQNRRKKIQSVADLRFQETAHSEALTTQDLASFKATIQEAMQDDLNTPRVFALLSELTDQASVRGFQLDSGSGEFFVWIDSLLGTGFSKSININDSQRELIESRSKARDEKDFALADELRNKISEAGITVKDTQFGQVWSRN